MTSWKSPPDLNIDLLLSIVIDNDSGSSSLIKFEPKLALDGGLDGLSVIRKVINKTSELLKKNGKFILEIGFNQKSKVIKLLNNKGFYINSSVKDLANNDRCIVSTKI